MISDTIEPGSVLQEDTKRRCGDMGRRRAMGCEDTLGRSMLACFELGMVSWGHVGWSSKYMGVPWVSGKRMQPSWM